ncbi:DMT family transporter [Paenarthrobacter sp. NPDC090522]|uniref:DMT family transporter n=1 Tax=Paenarthrobacter sp. NPDC090522 TaxID=3364383 RepID=UPI00380287DE
MSSRTATTLGEQFTEKRPGSGVWAYASLAAAALFWAGNYVIGARAVAALDPMSLAFLRWLLAVGPLFLIARFMERPRWREVFAAWPWLVAMGILGMLGHALLLYTALQYTDAFTASVVNAFNPALITVAASILLRQRLSLVTFGGVLLALAGVLIALTDGDISHVATAGLGLGEWLMIGAIVVWTGYTIVGRRAPFVPPITGTAIQAAVSVLVLGLVTVLLGGPELPGGPGEFFSLGYIAVFPSVFSYVLWNRALMVIPPSNAGIFLNLTTVFTAAISAVMGFVLTPVQILGSSIVILGVVLVNGFWPRRR